jgi:hypothetical protein
MNDVIETLRPRQRHTVHADLLVDWVNPRPQLYDRLSVDLDTPRDDQFFALTPTGDTSGSQHFLQPL